MLNLNHETKIVISDIPTPWIPKIELYYPDLPQFPIMYIHTMLNGNHIIACPVAVSYEVHGSNCDAEFLVLVNQDPTQSVIDKVTDEVSERIGFSNKITRDTIINCCKGNTDYINVLTDLWNYVEKSYGSAIPYGKLYDDVYSIPRFVAAWQPKTGRQSEMRMLYNFMSAFGEEVCFPVEWSHLEYYVIPTYEEIRNKNYSLFPKFAKLYHAMTRLFQLDFSRTITINNINFNVMPSAWKRNKNDFITDVTAKYYSSGAITQEDKYYAEILVDAFNRHPWRAAYFISAFLNIEQTDYYTWTKGFFKTFYDSGWQLKGYSEKVMACFLQQGFANDEVIPIDTWIETFYHFPLGIDSRSDFYDSFDMLGKLERMIWLASQANKTNMKNFFDILWCQRYGTIGNKELRGVNPIACSLCKLKKNCVGLSQIKDHCVYISNTLNSDDFNSIPEATIKKISFICLLENDVPKKVYRKFGNKWDLVDEFSGYLMKNGDSLPKTLVSKQIITVNEFISNY